MENATKALLIGAGILFAIIILSLAIFGYQQITQYYGEKQEVTTVEQIAEFNRQYEAYNRNDVTGFELVSLINKIIDFNANNAVDQTLGFNNVEKAYQKMYVEFTTTDSKLLNGIDGKKLFTKSTYNSESSKVNDELEAIIDEMQDLENKYTAAVLSKLVSNRESLEIYGGDGSKDIKQVLGKNMTDLPQKEKVLKYEQYIEFKRAEFKCTGTEYNRTTGRIVKLIFMQN